MIRKSAHSIFFCAGNSSVFSLSLQWLGGGHLLPNTRIERSRHCTGAKTFRYMPGYGVLIQSIELPPPGKNVVLDLLIDLIFTGKLIKLFVSITHGLAPKPPLSNTHCWKGEIRLSGPSNGSKENEEAAVSAWKSATSKTRLARWISLGFPQRYVNTRDARPLFRL